MRAAGSAWITNPVDVQRRTKLETDSHLTHGRCRAGCGSRSHRRCAVQHLHRGAVVLARQGRVGHEAGSNQRHAGLTATGTNGNRAAPLTDLKSTIYGLKYDSAAVKATCSFATVSARLE